MLLKKCDSAHHSGVNHLLSPVLAPHYFDPLSVKDVVIHPDYQNQFTHSRLIQEFAWFRMHNHSALVTGAKIRLNAIPIQCGRACKVDIDLQDGRPEVTAKGGGYNPEFASHKNLIRYQSPDFPKEPGFDGKFLYAEAIQDFFNAEVLKQLGVVVSQPVGILDLGRDDSLFSFHSDQGEKRAAIYVRSFLNQTRISDLFDMEPEAISETFERARHLLFETGQTHKLFSLEEYFYFIADRIAKSAAILQAVGFKHGVLHAQQVTVAGELCDLGTGFWLEYPKLFHWNQRDLCNYSKFSRQPITFQNFIVRTHALSSESSALLGASSKALIEQKFSILGAFQKAFPILAQKIKSQNPAHFFWKSFDFHLRHVDLNRFHKNFIPEMFFPNFKMDQFKSNRMRLLKRIAPKKLDWGMLPERAERKKNYETDIVIDRWLSTPYDAPKECDLKNKVELALSEKRKVLTRSWFGASFPAHGKRIDRKIEQFTQEINQAIDSSIHYGEQVNRVLDLTIYEMNGTTSKTRALLNPFFIFSHFLRYKLKKPVNAEYYLKGIRQCHDMCQLGEVLMRGIQKVFPEAQCMVLEAPEGPREMHWGFVVKIAENDIRLVDPSFGLNFELGLALSHPYLDRRFGRFWNFFSNARSAGTLEF